MSLGPAYGTTGGSGGDIANGSVTNAKLANMTGPALKGRSTDDSGAPSDLSPVAVANILPTVSTGQQGLAPDPDGALSRFLSDSGAWLVAHDAVGASTNVGVIDASTAQIAQRTLTANTEISFINMPSGYRVTLHLQAGGFTVTWPVGIKWVGSAPTLTANDVLTFWMVGAQLYGSYMGSVI